MPTKTYFAFVDEAGAKGYIRDVPPGRDTEFAIMAALLVEQVHHRQLEAAFKSGYLRFAQAAGSETLHFTAAFRDPNGPWAETAREVRREFFDLLLHYRIPIIYSVFRADSKRAEHQARLDLVQELVELKKSPIEIKPAPDSSTLETDTFQDLLVKLGTFAEDQAAEIEVRLDETSPGLLKSFRRAGKDLETLGDLTITPKGYDREANRPVQGMTGRFTLSSTFPVPLLTIKTVTVASKSDPLVLVIDCIVNSLHHHLRKMSQDIDLEAKASLHGWELETLVQLAP